MVEIVNAVSTGVRRPTQFFHLPVPKPRTDDAYFAPFAGLKLRPETEFYLGLVHRDDMVGNAARLAVARSRVRVDGVATECGMARGDPARFPELLAAQLGVTEGGLSGPERKPARTGMPHRRRQVPFRRILSLRSDGFETGFDRFSGPPIARCDIRFYQKSGRLSARGSA
jgi:hypothetical protein